MSLKKYYFFVVCIGSFFFKNSFSYHVEHFGRVINSGTSPIVINYQLCDLKKEKYKDSETICTDYQTNLDPISLDGYFVEFNLDQNKINNYIVYHQIKIITINDGGHITRFRQSEDQVNDDPSKPLQTYCSIFSSTSALILNNYGDKNYHCLVVNS